MGGWNKYSIEEIKKMTPEVREGFECLSNKWIDSITKIKFRCPFGHEFETTWASFRYSKVVCKTCRRTTGIDKKGKNRIYRDRNWLYDQYINKLRSTKEIGKICGVGHRLILSWLNEFNIETRNASLSTAIGQFTGKNRHIFTIVLKDNEKICPKCERVLDKNEFRKNSFMRDGLQSYCKYCLRSYGEYGCDSEFRIYRNKVDIQTNINYRKYFYFINPQKLQRSYTNYQLDHIVSVRDGFDNNIKIDIVASPVNLRLIPSSENYKKRARSDMSIKDLYRLHKVFFIELEKEYSNGRYAIYR